MRGLVELLMGVWPINRLMVVLWRHFPFPRGVRSRIMRTANDRFLVGVMAVIQDEQGRLLLVRNTYQPEYSWSLPGGWMGKREQPEECIVRELAEETGYEMKVERLLTTRSHPRLPSVDIVYRGRIVNGTFRPSAEITDARFFSLKELPDGLTPLHHRLLEWTEVLAEEDHK